MIPTKDQLSAAIDRSLTIGITWLLTWLASKGIITTSQIAEFSPLILTLVGGAYGLWVAKPSNIMLAASNIPGTTIVTTPELAQATPSDKVISSSNTSAIINKEVQINKDAEIKSTKDAA